VRSEFTLLAMTIVMDYKILGLFSTAEPMPVIPRFDPRSAHRGVTPVHWLRPCPRASSAHRTAGDATTDVLSLYLAGSYPDAARRRCLSSLGRRSSEPLSGHDRSLRMAVETLPSVVNQACLSTSRDRRCLSQGVVPSAIVW
jgi:hypothetical protein